MTQTAVAYFFYSLGILFREGMEAMLVVVALAAGTRGAGRIGRARDIYAGAAAAIVASIVLAWAVNHLITDDASDTLEGVFQLFAAATLFYVSSWMTSKGQSDFAARTVHDRDYLGAWRADASNEPRPLAAIHASHQEIDRLNMTKSPKKA